MHSREERIFPGLTRYSWPLWRVLSSNKHTYVGPRRTSGYFDHLCGVGVVCGRFEIKGG